MAIEKFERICRNRLSFGKKTVVYFYPKASTPGCTAEACSLRDNYDRFLAAGYNVVGISRDSVKAQKNFSDKNALPFPLLSDPDASIIKAFGAWGEKKLYGKTYEGILRKTFIFNEKGELVEIIDKVELTGLREETVLEKDRFGVESGELIVSPKVRDFPLRDKNGMPSMKKTIRWQ